MITAFFRYSHNKTAKEIQWLRKFQEVCPDIDSVRMEICFLVDSNNDIANNETLTWLLAETSDQFDFGTVSRFEGLKDCILEVGPRLAFVTSKSSNSVAIFKACGLVGINRIEQTRRFLIEMKQDEKLSADQRQRIIAMTHDRMTEMPFPETLMSFDTGQVPVSVNSIPVMTEGMDALRKVNIDLGLSMDEQDLEIWYNFFVKDLRRDPTDVELFQIGSCNSEHCRHGLFRGRLVIDGDRMNETLMDIIKMPWKTNRGNSLIAFCDDSSAIIGRKIQTIMPENPGKPSKFDFSFVTYHPTLTAETHNFPTGVAPFSGAETGTGGRIRDNQAVGQGGLVIAGGAAYCVGNLHIPGYVLSWEEDGWGHPEGLASPLQILIEASNGASNYGNNFGEPVIFGFTRAFGMPLANGYRSWLKPIMYTVGAGQIDDHHIKKGEPENGMLVVQIGGPAYKIGLGGGPASSMIQGDNAAELDFNAVQRGDAQVEQCMNRLIRACIEMGEDNPIISIHDLGAAGDCNAITELVNPAGAIIDLRSIPLGDKSLSVLEYWGNESQERHVLLIWPEKYGLIKEICDRECVPCEIVGRITGDGMLILRDSNDGSEPVNLPLDRILGDLPQKTFKSERIKPYLEPLIFPKGLTIEQALEKVLMLPSVGSKRFLTTKVDRSVTGLIAQQQCVGPNQLTLSDYAAIAQSHFSLSGVALSLGEKPLIGLLLPGAMARMAVAEALLNMAGAKITSIENIKCSANWMLAAKLPGEGAWLYDAAKALCDILLKLGFAIDGGKDSLSMAAKTLSPDVKTVTVKSPGELVLALYAPMLDITRKVTPDIKKPNQDLIFIDLAHGEKRLGGSALAHVFNQIGNECPDIEDIGLLSNAFKAVQSLIENGYVDAVHDTIGDGGFITALLEMAFSGNVGLKIHMNNNDDGPDILSTLFCEEAGIILGCSDRNEVERLLCQRHIPYRIIGSSVTDDSIGIFVDGRIFLNDKMTGLRKIWEQTSAQIDRLQANPDCVDEEQEAIADILTIPPYRISFTPTSTPEDMMKNPNKHRVAIIRGAGSNGDREMASAFFAAGFEVKDVMMSDLLKGVTDLDEFRGIVFVGGFTYADVLGAAKGWAGIIRFNESVSKQFGRFYDRSDTFSFGVCNGCQLMALIGWVPWKGIETKCQPRFIGNLSYRFESRFSTVKILESPAIMLKGMEGSTLGIWVAHGEGRCYWPSKDIYEKSQEKLLMPIRFVDYENKPTERYPFNPNGSREGITAICSKDGRHLAMMPHPERVFLKWQWPYWPSDWNHVATSPWMRMFQNAREWCDQNN